MRGVVASILVGTLLVCGTMAGAAYWLNQQAEQREGELVEAVESSNDGILVELRKMDDPPLASMEYSSSPSVYLGVRDRMLLAVEAIAEALTSPVPYYQDW